MRSIAALIKDTVIHSDPVVVELLPLSEQESLRPTDLYDPVGLIPVGKWKGQAVDTSFKRPARIVYEDDQQILFANFLDGGQFHQAHIPLDGVESVYFRINRFPSGIKNITPAHTLLYFKMKPGSEVILEGAGNVQDLSHPHAVSEFVFSVDYAAPKDVSYEMLGGLTPNFLTVMNFSSAYDYSLRGSDPNFAVEYLKLNLTAKDKAALLREAVHLSDERSYNYAYELLRYNCTTALFELFDDVLKYPPKAKIKPYFGSVFKAKDPVAGPSEESLVKRGLVDRADDGSLPAIWADSNGTLPYQ